MVSLNSLASKTFKFSNICQTLLRWDFNRYLNANSDSEIIHYIDGILIRGDSEAIVSEAQPFHIAFITETQ